MCACVVVAAAAAATAAAAHSLAVPWPFAPGVAAATPTSTHENQRGRNGRKMRWPSSGDQCCVEGSRRGWPSRCCRSLAPISSRLSSSDPSPSLWSLASFTGSPSSPSSSALLARCVHYSLLAVVCCSTAACRLPRAPFAFLAGKCRTSRLLLGWEQASYRAGSPCRLHTQASHIVGTSLALGQRGRRPS